MEQLPFRSDIFYSVQNEDYRTEIAMLRRLQRSGTLRILMVASAGENPLSVLAEYPDAEVHAVDTNAAQVHLCELRRAATSSLSREEHLRFLGVEGAPPGQEGAALRLGLYETVRQHLPHASQLFWDTRRDQELAFGVHFVGRNDVLMREIQTHLHAAGFAPLLQPLRDDQLAAWQAAYAEVMNVPYFLQTFGLPSELAAAKLAGLAGRTAKCHFRALQQPQANHNYFLTTALANRYAPDAGADGYPLYLQAQGYATLQKPGCLDRLHLHIGSIVDHAKLLVSAAGPLDLISISNIAEWMDDRQLGTIVSQLSTCLTPGGALLARTASDSRMIFDVISELLHTVPEFNAELATVERGPWFRTIVAGFQEASL